ncbi:MAG: hypothetical protein ACXWUX_04225 [Allosphingosinicella sp.]
MIPGCFPPGTAIRSAAKDLFLRRRELGGGLSIRLRGAAVAVRLGTPETKRDVAGNDRD